jgi:hypothetical protein
MEKAGMHYRGRRTAAVDDGERDLVRYETDHAPGHRR